MKREIQEARMEALRARQRLLDDIELSRRGSSVDTHADHVSDIGAISWHFCNSCCVVLTSIVFVRLRRDAICNASEDSKGAKRSASRETRT